MQLFQKKPPLMMLLRNHNEQPISLRKLQLLLKPTFDVERGSNVRATQDEAYRVFVNYLREVAGNVFN